MKEAIITMAAKGTIRNTEQQLQAQKQQYEANTKEFELRIAALEQQIEKEKNVSNQLKINGERANGNHALGHSASTAQEAGQKNFLKNRTMSVLNFKVSYRPSIDTTFPGQPTAKSQNWTSVRDPLNFMDTFVRASA